MLQTMPHQPDPLPRPLDHLAELAGAAGRGESPALVLREGTLNHNQLRLRVARLAGWLAREVPEKGARVASWAAKGELTCLMPLAAARAGLVHVPVNPLLKRAQVAHILADSGARMLVGTPSRLATLEGGDLPEGCAALDEAAALAAAEAAGLELGASQADPSELAAILYTSGSTGRPKGVMLSHANMWLGAVSVAQYLGLAADDVTLGVLPSGGSGTWVHGILPTLTISIGGIGVLARFSRSAMIEVMGQPYIRTAAAKGVKWRNVVRGHALPNAAVPIVTLVGFMVGSLIAGAVVVETIFSWPGIGRLLIVSVSNRDLAVVQCILLLIAAVMVVSNLVVDLLYGALDPRLRAQPAT